MQKRKPNLPADMQPTEQVKPNYASLVAAGLGAVKLVAEAFGYSFITNEQIDAVVNLVATGAVIAGILINNFKKK